MADGVSGGAAGPEQLHLGALVGSHAADVLVAVLVDLGVPMGPVIASIHEKRDQLRAQIMEEGELDEKPKLKSASLRERGA